jgi:hypothetical protein
MDFADKTGALAQLWIDFREDEDFSAFMEYNDIGVPMAYFISEGLVNPTPLGEQYVEESLDMMFKLLEITEDEIDELEDQSLGSILVFAYNKKNPGADTSE